MAETKARKFVGLVQRINIFKWSMCYWPRPQSKETDKSVNAHYNHVTIVLHRNLEPLWAKVKARIAEASISSTKRHKDIQLYSKAQTTKAVTTMRDSEAT